MRRPASPEFIRSFADSLPVAYRDRFTADAITAHASISEQRGGKVVKIGAFPAPETTASAVCLVAVDRPGLLSTISTALVLRKLDVVAAEAYTRTDASGASEAVDVFFLRRVGELAPAAPLDDDEIAALEELIESLLEGSATVETLAKKGEPFVAPPRPADTLVRFLDDSDGGLTTLEVETTDRSGLLFALSTALFQQRVQIVRSEVRTVESRVFDRFTLVEFDGSPITPARRLDIQVAVMHAVEPARRSQPPQRDASHSG